MWPLFSFPSGAGPPRYHLPHVVRLECWSSGVSPARPRPGSSPVPLPSSDLAVLPFQGGPRHPAVHGGPLGAHGGSEPCSVYHFLQFLVFVFRVPIPDPSPPRRASRSTPTAAAPSLACSTATGARKSPRLCKCFRSSFWTALSANNRALRAIRCGTRHAILINAILADLWAHSTLHSSRDSLRPHHQTSGCASCGLLSFHCQQFQVPPLALPATAGESGRNNSGAIQEGRRGSLLH